MRKLVLITSESCPPCKRFKETVWDAQIVPKADAAKIEHVPVEGNFARVKQWRVTKAPCVLLVQCDTVVARFVGSAMPPVPELLRWLEG